MKDKFLNSAELLRAEMNIKALEARLGHEVPPYMINMDDVSKKFLNDQEMLRLEMNIRALETNMSSSRRSHHKFDFIENLFFIIPSVFFIIAFIIIVIEKF